MDKNFIIITIEELLSKKLFVLSTTDIKVLEGFNIDNRGKFYFKGIEIGNIKKDVNNVFYFSNTQKYNSPCYICNDIQEMKKLLDYYYGGH